MRKLVYSTSRSSDGLYRFRGRKSRLVVPDAELHRHFNDVAREVETLLYLCPLRPG
jgi:hypothetical protein